MHGKRAEWTKDVFSKHVSLISLSPFKNRKCFQVILELYTYFLRNHCCGQLHRNTSKKCYRCCTSSPRYAGVGTKAKQWNFKRLSIPSQFCRQSYNEQILKDPLLQFSLKMILRDFWLWTKRCQSSLTQEHMALTEQVQATEVHYLE